MSGADDVPLSYIPSRLRKALEHYAREFDDIGMAVAKAQIGYIMLASAHNAVIDELATYVLEVEGLRDVVKAYEEEREILGRAGAGGATEGTEGGPQVDLYFGGSTPAQPGGSLGTGNAAPLQGEGNHTCGEGGPCYSP